MIEINFCDRVSIKKLHKVIASYKKPHMVTEWTEDYSMYNISDGVIILPYTYTGTNDVYDHLDKVDKWVL